jgi:lysozyme
MPLPDPSQRRYLTPRQRIAAGVATVCCGIAAVTVSIYEGTIFKAYPDPVLGWKAPTACTGHMDPNMDRNARFTADECRELLETDLRDHYNGIAKSSCIGDVPMPDHQLAAWLSLSFNIGVANFCRSSIPAKLKAGDAIAACDTIRQFRFVGGKDCALAMHNCRGIVRRREAEWKLCVGDVT